MRLRRLIKGDLRFIWKYGIAFVYIVFTCFYLFVLFVIPDSARNITNAILIYTDPAAMGLFFMGAFIILEKSQQVNCSLAVSPVALEEYIVSKAVSLMIPGVIVAVILHLFTGMISEMDIWKLLLMIPAVVLSSILFSLCGLICAVNTNTINGFIIAVVPFEIVIILPSIMECFDVFASPFWLLHPGVAAMRLILGYTELWYLGIPVILFWTFPAFLWCRKSVQKYFAEMGGGKIV